MRLLKRPAASVNHEQGRWAMEGMIQYAILLPVLYLGVVSSIEDFRYGKIYRRHISLGLWVGGAWYLMLGAFLILFLDDTSFFLNILPRVLAAVLIAFLISGVMWWFDIWSAADAKLFTVYVLLLPPAVTLGGGTKTFFSLVLLVNVYTAAFVIISIDFLIRFGARLYARWRWYRQAETAERGEVLTGLMAAVRSGLPGWIRSLLGFSLILVVVRILRSLARRELAGVMDIDETLLFLLLFLAFKPLHAAFQIKLVAAGIVTILAGYVGWLFLQDPSGSRVFEMVGIGLWVIGLISFRFIYTYWAELVELTRVPLDELEVHMIVSKQVRSELLEQEVFSADEIKTFSVEGLSEEYAKRIRQLYRNEEHPESIDIEKTIPFAPFLFAGVLITIAIRDIVLRF